jgi:HSP20 family protein
MRTLVKLHNASPFVNSYFDDFIRRDSHKGFLKSVPVNVKENEGGILLELLVPGFEKSDFAISVESGVLKIAAKVKSEVEGSVIPEKIIVKEFEVDSFERKFKVSDEIEVERVTAKYLNGILHVNLPRKISKQNEDVKSITIE